MEESSPQPETALLLAGISKIDEVRIALARMVKDKRATSARTAPTLRRPLRPPGASRQVGFHQLLVAARKKFFMDALSEALLTLDPRI